jgi:hypothetical protein
VSPDNGGSISASCQLPPPSVLTWTRLMPRAPAKAMPDSTNGCPSRISEPLRGTSIREEVLTIARVSQPWPSQ